MTTDPQGNTITATQPVEFTDTLTGAKIVGVVTSIEGGILLNVKGRRTTEIKDGNFQIHANQVRANL